MSRAGLAQARIAPECRTHCPNAGLLSRESVGQRSSLPGPCQHGAPIDWVAMAVREALDQPVKHHRAAAEGDPQRRARLRSQVCAACHSLRTGLNMTGAHSRRHFGPKAGSLTGFYRYFAALRPRRDL